MREMRESIPYIIDQLTNSMEFYGSPKEFADHMSQQTGVAKPTFMSMFAKYWELDPMDRFVWDTRAWSQWLRKNFNIRETVMRESRNRLNCAVTPLAEARAYAEAEFSKAGMDIEKELPDFDKNYKMLQDKCSKALDIPRIEMPVIEPDDIIEFKKDLKKGHIDIFPPYTLGSPYFPKDLDKRSGEDWIGLGMQDGDPKDDIVFAQIKRIPAKDLLPTQSQIWLEKVIGSMIQFGLPKEGSPISETVIITSEEGYILDGHHRFGQAIIGNPTLQIQCLFVPMDIDLLLKVGRSYGNAIGNRQKASHDDPRNKVQENDMEQETPKKKRVRDYIKEQQEENSFEIIEILEEVEIPQGEKEVIILEKGDKIKVRVPLEERFKVAEYKFYTWAGSAIINDDYSGVDDAEEQEIEAFIAMINLEAREQGFKYAYVVDVKEDEEFGYPDMPNSLRGDVSTFVVHFQK